MLKAIKTYKDVGEVTFEHHHQQNNDYDRIQWSLYFRSQSICHFYKPYDNMKKPKSFE
jgi:hypothetical protein